jgi:transcriptional regulator with XRE-family HTH domain
VSLVLTEFLAPALAQVCSEGGRSRFELAELAGNSRLRRYDWPAAFEKLRVAEIDRILVAAESTYTRVECAQWAVKARRDPVHHRLACFLARDPAGLAAFAASVASHWRPWEELPAAIRAARAVRGWPQDGLAHRAGLSQMAISRHERAVSRPSARSLRRLAGALGFEPGGLGLLAAAAERTEWPCAPAGASGWRARNYPSLTLAALPVATHLLRRSLNYPLRHVAEATRIHPERLKRHELGVTLLRLNDLASLCAFYHVCWIELEAIGSALWARIRGDLGRNRRRSRLRRRASAPEPEGECAAQIKEVHTAWSDVSRALSRLDLSSILSTPIAGCRGSEEPAAQAEAEIRSAFGRRLRNARKRLELTYRQAAGRSGIAIAQFYAYEAQGVLPGADGLPRLARAVEVAPEDLLPSRPPKGCLDVPGATWAAVACAVAAQPRRAMEPQWQAQAAELESAWSALASQVHRVCAHCCGGQGAFSR